jgi:hypothetical protein
MLPLFLKPKPAVLLYRQPCFALILRARAPPMHGINNGPVSAAIRFRLNVYAVPQNKWNKRHKKIKMEQAAQTLFVAAAQIITLRAAGL